MAKLSRTSLMVDGEKIKELARQHGISEPAAVREAVDHALAAAEVMAAIRALHTSKGIDDVFGRLPDVSSMPALARQTMHSPLIASSRNGSHQPSACAYRC